MASDFRVNTQELRKTATSFGQKGKTMAMTMEEMMSLVNGLRSVYEGDASDAYVRTFSGLQDDISKINAKIQEHVSDLNEIADKFDGVVKDTAAKDAALPNNILQ